MLRHAFTIIRRRVIELKSMLIQIRKFPACLLCTTVDFNAVRNIYGRKHFVFMLKSIFELKNIFSREITQFMNKWTINTEIMYFKNVNSKIRACKLCVTFFVSSFFASYLHYFLTYSYSSHVKLVKKFEWTVWRVKCVVLDTNFQIVQIQIRKMYERNMALYV